MTKHEQLVASTWSLCPGKLQVVSGICFRHISKAFHGNNNKIDLFEGRFHTRNKNIEKQHINKNADYDFPKLN